MNRQDLINNLNTELKYLVDKVIVMENSIQDVKLNINFINSFTEEELDFFFKMKENEKNIYISNFKEELLKFKSLLDSYKFNVKLNKEIK